MWTEKEIKKVERIINSKMNLIKSKALKPSESNIGILFKKLKDIDEVSYEKLIIKYKEILLK